MMRDEMTANTRGYGWKAVTWLMGMFGGVAALLGLFIMFGPEDDFVGIGGDWAWRVSDVSSAWMYGLLIGGAVLLVGMAYMLIVGRRRTALKETPRGNLLWHTVVFILVNAFVWVQDFALGTGLDYAYMLTVPWAVGLAVHAFTYFSQKSYRETIREVQAMRAEDRELLHH